MRGQRSTDESAGSRPIMTRRRFVGALGGAAAIGYGLGPGRSDLAALVRAARWTDGYGDLGPADELGVRVPDGFTASLVGRTGDRVAGTTHTWHAAPDGGACFPAPDGFGHVYVSNSEVGNGGGGVSAVRFDAGGRIESAMSILAGTSKNCAGGGTPWGTWLSCEENGAAGQVWECDPQGGAPHVRAALGSFNHEAAAVDIDGRQVFLTEDHPDGRLYRFRPTVWPDLDRGVLEAAVVIDRVVSWRVVSADAPDRSAQTASFNGGEGAVVADGSLMFATKGDRRIWELDLESGGLSVFHDCVARPDTALSQVDNLAVHPHTGHLFVAEDAGDMDLCMLVRRPEGAIVTRVVRFEGHDGSEVAGPAFSPAGGFLYLSSQRGSDGRGVTVQIAGPFMAWIRSIDSPAAAGQQAVRADNRHTVPPELRPRD